MATVAEGDQDRDPDRDPEIVIAEDMNREVIAEVTEEDLDPAAVHETEDDLDHAASHETVADQETAASHETAVADVEWNGANDICSG